MYRPTLIFLKNNIHRLETVYATAAFLFGLFFIFLIPPGWNPDEPQHYWRAQQAAHGNVIPDNLAGPPGVTYTGGTLPTNEIAFIQSFGVDKALQNNTYRAEFPLWKNKGAMVHESENTELGSIAFPGAARYSPVAYAPQIVGLWIGDKLHIPLMMGFYLAKIIGLLVQVGFFTLAIRFIPKAKWSLFALGLLPSTIVQSTAFGGDVMTTSVCILFIATVLKLAYTKVSFNKYWYSLVLLLVFLLGLVKPTYLPLTAILVIIPLVRKKYFHFRQLCLAVALIGLMAAPGVYWVKATDFIQDHFSNGVNPQLQSKYVKEHPSDFASATLRTYLTDEQPRTYKNLFGNFIWDTAPIPLVFMFIAISVITTSTFISDRREVSKIKMSTLVRTIFLSVFIFISVLISYALYVYFTPLKQSTILGIQGRYFIPLLPLVFVLFHNPLPLKSQFHTKIFVTGGLISLLICSMVVIINRIYI